MSESLSPSSGLDLTAGEAPALDPIVPGIASGAGATFWTEPRIARLKDLQAQNYSGRRIAAEMGITRNAAMGKLARLGLKCESQIQPPRSKRSIRPRAASGRGAVQRVEAKVRANFAFPTPKAKPKAPVKEPTVTPILARPPESTPATACSIFDLTNESCRWPCGGVMDPVTVFCGAPGADLAAGVPYCGFHSRLAYTPVRGRL